MARYRSDILTRNLDVAFCGLNPAESAAADGHNFSTRSNRFWSVLHIAGSTDICLCPHDGRRLLRYGCGITAVVSRLTMSAADVSLSEYRDVRLAFEAKIRRYSPRCVAFLGKRALSAMTGQSHLDWGERADGFAGAMAWIRPNPSRRNQTFTLDALVQAYSELRMALTP